MVHSLSSIQEIHFLNELSHGLDDVFTVLGGEESLVATGAVGVGV